MPLFIHDDEINALASTKAKEVINSIKFETEINHVTPNLALVLLKKHLVNQLADEDNVRLRALSNPSWRDLYEVYQVLSSKIENCTNPYHELVDVIRLMVTQTKMPYRRIRPRQSPDTTYYLNTCNKFDLKIATFRWTDNGIDTMNFCKYCWRHPSPSRSICPFHRPLSGIAEATNKGKNSSGYRESYRQKQTFEAYITDRTTVENFEFFDSDLEFPYFIPNLNIYAWLLKRRPYVAEMLVESKLATNDREIIKSLLNLLHMPNEHFHWNERNQYIEINELIAKHPELIWPMLLRADTWLELRHTIHSNWGGSKTRGKQYDNSQFLPPINQAIKWANY